MINLPTHQQTLKPHLLPGEKIEVSIGADIANTVGVLAHTNKRLLYVGAGVGAKVFSIALSKVSQLYIKKGIFSTGLQVDYSGGSLSGRVHDAKDAKKLVDSVTLATLA